MSPSTFSFNLSLWQCSSDLSGFILLALSTFKTLPFTIFFTPTSATPTSTILHCSFSPNCVNLLESFSIFVFFRHLTSSTQCNQNINLIAPHAEGAVLSSILRQRNKKKIVAGFCKNWSEKKCESHFENLMVLYQGYILHRLLKVDEVY